MVSRPVGSTTAPSDRGNISYQDPNSARCRSTWRAAGREALTRSRSGSPAEHLHHVGREGGGVPLGGCAGGVTQRVGRGQHHGAAVLLGYPGRRALVQFGPLGEDQFGVDARGDLDARVVPPGGHRIAPGLHRVRPAALRGRGHLGAPSVGAGGEFAHGDPWPGTSRGAAQDHVGRHRVMSLTEHRGGDLEGLADHGLGGAAAAVDQRADVQDGDTTDHCASPVCAGGRTGTFRSFYRLLRMPACGHDRSCPRSLGWADTSCGVGGFGAASRKGEPAHWMTVEYSPGRGTGA